MMTSTTFLASPNLKMRAKTTLMLHSIFKSELTVPSLAFQVEHSFKMPSHSENQRSHTNPITISKIVKLVSCTTTVAHL